MFVLPLEKEFGWTRAQTSWVFTIAIVCFALSFIVAIGAGGTFVLLLAAYLVLTAGYSLYVKGKLLLADRGYPCLDYFEQVIAAGGFFLMRIKTDVNPKILAVHGGGRRRPRHEGYRWVPDNN